MALYAKQSSRQAVLECLLRVAKKPGPIQLVLQLSCALEKLGAQREADATGASHVDTAEDTLPGESCTCLVGRSRFGFGARDVPDAVVTLSRPWPVVLYAALQAETAVTDVDSVSVWSAFNGLIEFP